MEYAISHETMNLSICVQKGIFSLSERSLHHGSNEERNSKSRG